MGVPFIPSGTLLADAGENDQRQGEADTDGNRVDDSLQQVIVLLDDLDRDTQHAAVRRNQRQEDPQRLVKGRRHLLQDDLDHLHQGGDHQDEHDRLHETQTENIQDVFLDQEGHDRRDRQHEGNGGPHSRGGLHLLGDTQKRAYTQELR